MIRFIKNLLGLTPKTPEQRAFAEFNTLLDLMEEHYCLQIHQSYVADIITFEGNHPLVDQAYIKHYAAVLRSRLDHLSNGINWDI